jgi:hypothetical protein
MKRMLKKGIAMVTFLVVLAMISITVVALSYAVFKILVILGVIAPKAVCEWSVVLIGLGKLGTGGVLDIPPECKTEFVEIKLADLEALESEAAQQIRFYGQQYQKEPRAWEEIFRVFNNPDSEQQRLEWALNQKMATELTKCWSKVWKGELPLFDEWWNLVDWNLYGFADKPKDSSDALRYLGEDVADFGGDSLLTVYGPPTFCIYCSRVVIDPQIKTKLGKNRVTSLTTWLKAKPVRPGSSESLFQFLLNENQRKFPIAQEGIDYGYNMDKPQAVEFLRTNELGATLKGVADTLVDGAKKLFGSPEGEVTPDRSNSRLVLVDAVDSIYPLSGQGLDDIVCLQQIG